MLQKSFAERRPLPYFDSFPQGILSTTVMVDVIAPELMNVEQPELFEYPLYRATRIGFNEPEPGYPRYTFKDTK